MKFRDFVTASNEVFDTTLPMTKRLMGSPANSSDLHHYDYFSVGDRAAYQQCCQSGATDCDRLYSEYVAQITIWNEESEISQDEQGKSIMGLYPVLEVHFARKNERGRYNQTDTTGSGFQNQVFGQMVNIVKHYIKVYKPAVVLTFVNTVDPSRHRLFKSIANWFSRTTSFTKDMSDQFGYIKQYLKNGAEREIIAVGDPTPLQSYMDRAYQLHHRKASVLGRIAGNVKTAGNTAGEPHLTQTMA